ncbi:hypothetical protein Golob_017055, partial [Gossypium lobatum]|nr:hypothetical protein [Gossypium lobatum]MBA0686057.1 hypothetical protein [Gossypium aridum]
CTGGESALCGGDVARFVCGGGVRGSLADVRRWGKGLGFFGCVLCRTLRSTKMTGDASEEAVPEIKYVRTSNSAEDHSGWVLSKQE